MPVIHRFQCLSCDGIYPETSVDGGVYAHVCGPIPADKKNPERERPNKRDENIARGGDRAAIGIRSEGAGVKCLTDPKIKEPRWISALHRHIETEEAKRNA